MAGRNRKISKGIRRANRVGRKFATGEANLQRLIYVIFAIALAIVLIRGAVTFHSLKVEERAVQEKYEQLQEEKAELEQNLKYINTPEYVERAARDMLKMVMPGEILYVLRDGTTKTEEEMQEQKQKEEQAAGSDAGGSGSKTEDAGDENGSGGDAP